MEALGFAGWAVGGGGVDGGVGIDDAMVGSRGDCVPRVDAWKHESTRNGANQTGVLN